MKHSSKRLVYLLIRNFLVLVLIFMVTFSFYINYVFNERLTEQKLEVLNQDYLLEANVQILKKEASYPIEYDNIPTSLNNYINCLNNGISDSKLSGEIKNRIQRLNAFLGNHRGVIGFAYEDLNTGFSLGYQENTPVFAASTTKAPLAIYIYEKADTGAVNLDSKYKYTSNYYAEGTGILKTKKFNTEYSIRDLIEYSIIYSDNSAFLMLGDKFSKKEASTYFKNKGAKNLYNSLNQGELYSIFGEISPNDGNIYMKELYSYSLKNTNNSKQLLSYFKNSALNNIKEATGLEVAHKYGWTGSYAHDMALVFDENPYVLTVTTILGDDDWGGFINLMATKVQEIHSLYWKELNNYCKTFLN